MAHKMIGHVFTGDAGNTKLQLYGLKDSGQVIEKLHDKNPLSVMEVLAFHLQAEWELYSVTTDKNGEFVYHIRK